MHREIQIKQFPIVTTHWWPKTRNERFVWENEQYLYRFLPLVHNHVQVIWVRTHIQCVTCVCARALAHAWRRACLKRGADATVIRSCCFWTVYSRIMMTSFKQTRLLSSLVFQYERSMYPFHSSVTSQHTCRNSTLLTLHHFHLTMIKITDPGTVYWDMTPAREKKKESYYDEGLVHE